MADFVWDNGVLNGAKANRGELPVGEDPNKWIQASQDWNPTIQAIVDLRNAIVDGVMHGFDPQVAAPDPVTPHSDYFVWVRDSDKNLIYHQNGTDFDLLTGAVLAVVQASFAAADTDSISFPTPSGNWGYHAGAQLDAAQPINLTNIVDSLGTTTADVVLGGPATGIIDIVIYARP